MEKCEIDVRVRAIYYLMLKEHRIWFLHPGTQAGVDPRGVRLRSDRQALKMIANNKRSWDGTLEIARRIMDKLVEDD